MDLNSKKDLLLALCCGLRGEVTSFLRASSIRNNNMHVSVYYYFNREISEDEQEDLSCITTEVIAQFPEQLTCEDFFIVKDFPEPLPKLGHYAFCRDAAVPKSVQRAETQEWPLLTQTIPSICQGLFGKVSSKLRAAGAAYTEGVLHFCFFLDAGATEEDNLMTRVAAKEAMADFSEFPVQMQIEEVPFPYAFRLPGTLKEQRLAYYIKEPPILRWDWKEHLFWVTCLSVPSWVQAIAFRVEQLHTLQNPGSVLFFYVFYEGIVEEQQFIALRKRLEQLGPAEKNEIIFKKRENKEPLPAIGSYAFSREESVPKTFTVAQMLQDLANDSLIAQVVVLQALLGAVSPRLCDVIVQELNGVLDVFFLFSEQDPRDEPLLNKIITEISRDLPHAQIHIKYSLGDLPTRYSSVYKRDDLN